LAAAKACYQTIAAAYSRKSLLIDLTFNSETLLAHQTGAFWIYPADLDG
jgi:hypothetical protein